VLKPLTELHSSIRIVFIMACNNLGVWTFHQARFRMHWILDLIIPVSRVHCPGDFCGDPVNCPSTTAAEAGLVAVQGPPDVCLCPSCTVTSASNLYECVQLLIVVEVPLPVHAATLLTFRTYSQIPNSISICPYVARKTTFQPPFSLTVLSFDKLALTFMWLAPSFEWISH
jgi:hypothetical protein